MKRSQIESPGSLPNIWAVSFTDAELPHPLKLTVDIFWWGRTYTLSWKGRNMALIWINYRLIDVLEDFWYMKKVIDILREGDRYFWYIFESSRQILMAQWDWLLMKASGIEFFLAEFDIEDMWFESFPNRQVPTWRVSGKSRSELMCANCSIEGLVCFVSLLS